jgi:hypothetical protein
MHALKAVTYLSCSYLIPTSLKAPFYGPHGITGEAHKTVVSFGTYILKQIP